SAVLRAGVRQTDGGRATECGHELLHGVLSSAGSQIPHVLAGGRGSQTAGAVVNVQEVVAHHHGVVLDRTQVHVVRAKVLGVGQRLREQGIALVAAGATETVGSCASTTASGGSGRRLGLRVVDQVRANDEIVASV